MSDDTTKKELEHFMEGLKKRNPHEPEFHQAVHEVAESVMPWYLERSDYRDAQILERLTEPDRIIIFRVCWEDDEGNVRVNRAWRVQFNNSIGPYKGGLRFSSGVDQSVLKFLGFEQIFKNSLTGLPMGAAKGGSNFNPKGKSRREIERFCQSMMCELSHHIGEDTDVPAGDIGVGAQEISFLFGQYKRLRNLWTGVLTGKKFEYGGSRIRTEATGYGAVYFCKFMLNQHDEELKDKVIAISGSGNVARYAAERALWDGAIVRTLSDSDGCCVFPDGMNEDHLSFVHDLKENRNGRVSEIADEFDDVEFKEGAKPWDVDCDVAMPCATQNELSQKDAETLVKNDVRAVVEGANMPCEPDAVSHFRSNNVLFAPGKAANAGGVAVSGLEQSQNSLRLSWSREKVDERLQEIMSEIHERCVKSGGDGEVVDYARGANISGFERVADAMLAYGVV